MIKVTLKCLEVFNLTSAILSALVVLEILVTCSVYITNSNYKLMKREKRRNGK